MTSVSACSGVSLGHMRAASAESDAMDEIAGRPWRDADVIALNMSPFRPQYGGCPALQSLLAQATLIACLGEADASLDHIPGETCIAATARYIPKARAARSRYSSQLPYLHRSGTSSCDLCMRIPCDGAARWQVPTPSIIHRRRCAHQYRWPRHRAAPARLRNGIDGRQKSCCAVSGKDNLAPEPSHRLRDKFRAEPRALVHRSRARRIRIDRCPFRDWTVAGHALLPCAAGDGRHDGQRRGNAYRTFYTDARHVQRAATHWNHVTRAQTSARSGWPTMMPIVGLLRPVRSDRRRIRLTAT